MEWIYLFTAIFTEVISTAALKSSEGFTKFWPSLIVIVGYAIAFYFLSLTLKTIPVGVAYAIWSGMGIVLISVIGAVLFRQYLDFPALLGIGLILTGVIILNVFSAAH
ncbi:Small Multidrug Resistance protein [Candidatus Protochlamydia naegleriophila]|uniref:Small Multidrug Resistance protein n=1 Tax=Candidatus Protochlamydia naegleriophila TaxID=389348 RepID=A0A0U5JCI2_9BACT|nr:multidrug efflux SMR transporter [Candidatus Protochlamydia naegleriophila]CUI16079.1 Small Multidrug Resistance protein [Candidatus Protochlamydia naegleriophila]